MNKRINNFKDISLLSEKICVIYYISNKKFSKIFTSLKNYFAKNYL